MKIPHFGIPKRTRILHGVLKNVKFEKNDCYRLETKYSPQIILVESLGS